MPYLASNSQALNLGSCSGCLEGSFLCTVVLVYSRKERMGTHVAFAYERSYVCLKLDHIWLDQYTYRKC